MLCCKRMTIQCDTIYRPITGMISVVWLIRDLLRD